MPPPVVDREALHRYMWERSDHQARFTLHQTRFAEELGCNRTNFSRILRQMQDQGKLKKLKTGGINVTFRISPPEGAEPKNQPRQPSWG